MVVFHGIDVHRTMIETYKDLVFIFTESLIENSNLYTQRGQTMPNFFKLQKMTEQKFGPEYEATNE